MNIGLWTELAAAQGIQFAFDSQRKLLMHALVCCGQTADIEDRALFATEHLLGVCTSLHGSGLFQSLRERSCNDLKLDSHSREGKTKTLILVAPDLPADFFDSAHPYSVGTLALRSVERCVVLCCPGDATLKTVGPCLGRDGATEGTDKKVSCIDISGLLEQPRNAAYSAFCSCEALGLIVRLLRGLSLSAALTPHAKLI